MDDQHALRDAEVMDGPATAHPGMREFILAQAHEPGGAAVLLFTPGSLHPPEQEVADPAVAAAAERLGLDLERIELFGFDAYRLQCALGAELLPAP